MADGTRRRTAWFLSLCACGLFLRVPDASAQSVGAISADVDNDYFDFFRPPDRRSDDNYTQGIHIGMWFTSSPRLLRGSAPSCGQSVRGETQQETCASSIILLGQELYTPTNDAPRPLPGERPYAALLYVDLSAARMNQKTLHVYGLRLGTTGHAALGDQAQDWFHRLVPQFRTPLGWQHQIASEPVIDATYEYHRLVLHARPTPRTGVTLAPSGSLTIGNLLVGAKAAIDVRTGYRVPHPWAWSEDAVTGARAYLLAGAQEELIGYSLLLQGNTSETRGLVAKRAAVTQWYGGFSAGLSRFSLEFKVVTRTREYETAPARHVWGTIGMSYGLN
jgi:hypothetical protein